MEAPSLRELLALTLAVALLIAALLAAQSQRTIEPLKDARAPGPREQDALNRAKYHLLKKGWRGLAAASLTLAGSLALIAALALYLFDWRS